MYLYKPFEERVPDYQYREAIRGALERGIRSNTQQGVDTFTIPHPVLHVFDLANGFPWDTLRSIKNSGGMAINELLRAFINGVRYNETLNKECGVPFWDSTFENPEKCRKRGLEQGDLGPASYGPVLHDFPARDGTPFDQLQAIVEQIRELPHLKTHIATTLYPPEIFRGEGKVQKVVTVPCHGTVILFKVFDGRLHMDMVQRSGDLLAGVPHNMIQYAALLLVMGQITGYPPSIFSHVILNPHIYENQWAYAKEMVEREPRPYPTVVIKNTDISDIHEFDKDDFVIEDYHPHPAIPKIPVAP